MSSGIDLSGRSVLVTGGLGFLGLNTVGGLLAAGAAVRVLSRSAPRLAISWLDRVASGAPVEVVHGDVEGAGRRPDWIEDVDAVVHLAGESGASWSLERPAHEVHANVEAQLFFLDALRRRREPPHVVFVSSRLVYGSPDGDTVTEETTPDPTSLYAAHKLTVEQYLRVYGRTAGMPWTILRATNPYGPYQLPERRTHGFVNRFVLNALAGEPIVLYGEGSQLRDVFHVGDLVDAILRALTQDAARSALFNVGSGSSIPLREIAERVAAMVPGTRLESREWPEQDLLVETGDFQCSIERIRSELGWSAQVGLDAGLERTISAYRELLADEAGFAR